MSAYVCLCLPMSAYVCLCLPMSAYVCLCLPMSAYVCLCLPMSAYVCLCLPMSAYVCLCLPMSAYVCLCLLMSVYMSAYVCLYVTKNIVPTIIAVFVLISIILLLWPDQMTSLCRRQIWWHLLSLLLLQNPGDAAEHVVSLSSQSLWPCWHSGPWQGWFLASCSTIKVTCQINGMLSITGYNTP